MIGRHLGSRGLPCDAWEAAPVATVTSSPPQRRPGAHRGVKSNVLLLNAAGETRYALEAPLASFEPPTPASYIENANQHVNRQTAVLKER